MTASTLKDWQSFPLLATSLLLCSSVAFALPTSDQLVAGQASVSNPAANVMQIDQTSQKAAINWQGFSIGQNEAVNINQPNAQASLLNRVVGLDASQIQGQLNANGQVYLVNPNGVIFGSTAQVDVGGIVATTHDISNQDFLTNKNHFTQNGATGSVENHGTINAANGGVVALIGESVTNTGTINTPKGTTALAAGKTVDLDFQGNGLVEVKVTEAALNAQITNQGAIQADAGRVVLSAKAANALVDTVINQLGIIRAQSLVERNGEIILDGGNNGIVQVSGTLNVQGQTGGKISIAGNNIHINMTALSDNAGGVITISGGLITIGDTNSLTTVQQGATVSADSNTQGNIHILDNMNGGTVYIAGPIDFTNATAMNNGTVNFAGQINATAAKQGDGGFIDTSAAKVTIADSEVVPPVVTPPVIVPPVVKPSDDVIPEKKQEVELVKPVIQVNFDLPTLSPLQVSTTFLNQFMPLLANYDDSVDVDYGQYKGNNYASTPVGYEWHKEHGKKQWSEKQYDHKNHINLKALYNALFIQIENGGIRLPVGLTYTANDSSDSGNDF